MANVDIAAIIPLVNRYDLRYMGRANRRRTMEIKNLEHFMDLAGEHELCFKFEIESVGNGRGMLGAAVGYPKEMKPKLRDAMREWAKVHRTELALHVLEIVRPADPQHDAIVAALKDVGLTPLN
jgi:hypothetical protein